jgi:cytochrome c-type biogenesis protein
MVRQISKSWRLFLLLAASFALVVATYRLHTLEWLSPLQTEIFHLEGKYQGLMQGQAVRNPLVLMAIALGGGLIASISPCSLSMLPVNISYILGAKIGSRRDALVRAVWFVAGVITSLSLLGLVSSFAGAVLVQYTGYLATGIGLLFLVMGLNLLGVLQTSFPQLPVCLPVSGAYAFGLSFALVSSPCASPLLFSTLAIAATAGSSLISVLTMIAYAIGWTALLFLASLFFGLVKQSRHLRRHTAGLMRVAGLILLLAGTFYLFSGIYWFVLVYR